MIRNTFGTVRNKIPISTSLAGCTRRLTEDPKRNTRWIPFFRARKGSRTLTNSCFLSFLVFSEGVSMEVLDPVIDQGRSISASEEGSNRDFCYKAFRAEVSLFFSCRTMIVSSSSWSGCMHISPENGARGSSRMRESANRRRERGGCLRPRRVEILSLSSLARPLPVPGLPSLASPSSRDPAWQNAVAETTS